MNEPTKHRVAESEVDRALAAWGATDRDDPFPLFAAVQRRGAVQAVTLADGHAAWLVTGAAEVRSALNDTRLSKNMHAAFAADGAVVAEGLPGPALAHHMLAVDPPDHTRLRRLVAGAFTTRRVEDLRPHVQEIVDELLDRIVERGPHSAVDLVADFAFPMPFAVICELLGVPLDDRAPFGAALTTLLTPTTSAEEDARARVASATVVSMLEQLVTGKQTDPGDDLVTALIAARDGDERLTQPELLSTIFQLIVAGHDTTATLIGNAVVALLTHPEQLARLQADPALIGDAIEEVLRFDGPVPHATFRYTIEPVELGGTVIPAGAQVIVNLAAANRDPQLNDEPDRFDMGRAEIHHLAFGHGIHFCLGARLARMEGIAAIATLVRRFPDLRLAVRPDALHWGHGDGLVLRGLSELPVVPGPARTRLDPIPVGA